MKTSKILLSILMMAGSLVLNTACSKKDDGGGGSVVVPPGSVPMNCAATNTCGGLTGAQGVLISAAGTASVAYAQVDVAVDLIGNAAAFNPADPKAAVLYSGPAALAGYLRVSGNTGTLFCNVIAGEYYMQAIQPGNMASGILTGGRISGVGPGGVRIDAHIIQGVLYNSQDPNGTSKGSATNRIYLQLVIDAVNALPCNVSFTTI